MDQLNKNALHDLVLLLKKGDVPAFNRIYSFYKDKIHRFAMRFVRCEETAEELTQLVFVQLWKSKDNLQEDKDFNAYLFTITRNLVYKEFQRKARHAAYEITSAGDEPAFDQVNSFMNFRDYARLTAEAIESLPPKTQQVFKLSREQGASYENISVELNISKNTVHAHMAKSLSHIRAYFKTHSPETVLTFLLTLNLF